MFKRQLGLLVHRGPKSGAPVHLPFRKVLQQGAQGNNGAKYARVGVGCLDDEPLPEIAAETVGEHGNAIRLEEVKSPSIPPRAEERERRYGVLYQHQPIMMRAAGAE